MLHECFFDKLNGIIAAIRDTQTDAVTAAAKEIAGRLERGGIIQVFGTGHSHIVGEELYARAGGLIQVKAIMPHELTVDLDFEKSTLMERTDGVARIVFETNKIRQDDVLILVSNSGRNPVPVQMALEAKARGIFTVAITNLAHSKSVESRDKSGKKLYEICDIVLDNCGPKGDAAVQVPGKNYAVAPVSNITGAILAEVLVCAVVETMLSHGVEPPVYQSSNVDGNDEFNRNAREKLKERFPGIKEVFATF
ncbi:MAG: SIS domain-containing protein [Treponema sp.]|jgi:uncharacterized phosphosugar-binding protein|nr:SIS domain-containing protein [Treponema sp.]